MNLQVILFPLLSRRGAFRRGGLIALLSKYDQPQNLQLIRPPLAPPAPALLACYQRDARTQGEN